MAGWTGRLKGWLAAIVGEVGWTPPPWVARLGAFSAGERAKGLLGSASAAGTGLLAKAREEAARDPKRFRLKAGAALGLVLAFVAVVVWQWRAPKYVRFSVSGTEPGPTRMEDVLKPEPVHIDFGGSAARLSDVGKAAGRGISMRPAQAGEWRWANDRRLIFTPKADWPVGAEFTVKLDRSLFPDHVRLERYDYRFKTAPFAASVESSEFYQDPKNPRLKKVIVAVRFTHPVDAAGFEKRIALRMAGQAGGFLGIGAKDQPFAVTYDKYKTAAYIHSQPVEIPSEDTFMSVAVNGGFGSSRGGPPQEAGLEARVPIPGVYTYFRVEGAELTLVRNERYEPEQALVLRLTAGALESEVQKSLRVYELPKDRPAFQGQPAAKDFRWYNPAAIGPEVLGASRLVALEPLPTDKEYAATHSFRCKVEPGRYVYVHLEKGVQSYGGYVLARSFDQIARVPEFPVELKIMYDGAILSLAGEKKVSVLARDVPAVRFELARVLPSQVNHLVSQSEGRFRNPEFDSSRFGPDNISERFTEVRRLDKSEPGRTNYMSFDLNPYLSGEGGRQGLFFFKAEAWDPVRSVPTGVEDKRLILVTDLGMLVKKTLGGGSVVFVQSIRDGSPVSDAQVQILGRNGLPVLSAPTDGEGRASFPSTAGLEREKEPVVYTARRGNDLSFLPFDWRERELDFSRFDVGGAVTQAGAERLQAYLFSDRGVYRPGDEIRVGMIVKPSDWNQDLAGVPLEVVATDARGLEVMRRKVALSGYGFEEIRHKTEEESPTGTYQFSAYIIKDGRRASLLGSAAVRVEEFLPDRLRIGTRLSRERLDGWVAPEGLKGLVSLRNLFGTPAASRRVRAVLRLSPSQPSFRAFPDFVFLDPDLAKNSFTERLPETETDDKGEAELFIDLGRFEKATYRLTFTAEGFEPGGGRSVVSESSVLVSARGFLVGFKPDGDLRYARRDSARAVELIAVDPALKKREVRGLTAQIVSRRYVSVLMRQPSGVYKYESVLRETTVKKEPLAIPASGLGYKLPTSAPGDYALVVRGDDDAELARVPFTVVGDANVTRSLEKNAELKVQLDKGDYAPGSEIEIQVTAPYAGAGLITIERERVYAQKWFKAQTTGSSQRIRVPADMEGNGYVVVSFVRSMDSPEIFMSPLSYGVAPFTISRERRTNKVTLECPGLARPGEAFKIRYQAAQPGKIVVFAVDEGILQVAGFRTPDPLSFFFAKKSLEVRTAQILDLILPEFKLLQQLSAPGGDAGRDALGRNLNPFKRKRDAPVAYWSGVIDAGTEPRELVYPVPDHFNGTLRVMAVAVAKDAVGVAERKSLVRGHFVLTPNAPLVAAPGDEFDVILGVANNAEGSGADASVRIGLKTSAQLSAAGAAERELKVREGREGSLTFRVRAKDVLGSGNLTFTASLGARRSQCSVDVSIRPPVPYVTSVAGGTLKPGGRGETPVTRRMYPHYRVLEASVSALPLGLARGLLRFLEQFPYVCTEQLVSQAFPVVALSGRPEFGYAPDKAEAMVQKAVAVLRARQNPEGAFGMWAANAFVSGFQNAYALHFLTEAKEKGHAVPPEMLSRGLNHLSAYVGGQTETLEDARARAYALYVLTRNGVVPSGPLSFLRKQLDERFPGEWRKDLVAVHLAAAYKLLRQDGQAADLIAGARFGDAQAANYDYFYDSLVRDSQLLYILARHFPDRLGRLQAADLERIVGPASSGGFNTLSASYAVLALDAYTSFLGPKPLAGAKVSESAKGAAPRALALPAGLFPKAAFSDKADGVAVGNGGGAPLFYQVTAAGFDLKPPQAEVKRKLEVQREYREENGGATGKASLGVPIEVHLKIRTVDGGSMRNVAVVDLLPGGFELVLEPLPQEAAAAPAVERPTPQEDCGEEGCGEGEAEGEAEGDGGGEAPAPAAQASSLPLGLPSSTWRPEYADAREDRVVLYGSVGPEAREFVYRIRPTNKGVYAVPPVFAESMYDRSAQAVGVPGRMSIE